MTEKYIISNDLKMLKPALSDLSLWECFLEEVSSGSAKSAWLNLCVNLVQEGNCSG